MHAGLFADLHAEGRRYNYQRPSRYCIPRLTPAIARQQQKPRKMGLPPDFTSFTRSVLRPIATMAMVMKNFESVFMGANASADTPQPSAMVVMSEASKK